MSLFGKKPKMPGETSEQKAVADVAMDEFLFGQELAPIQRDYFARMGNWSNEGAQIQGMANTGAQAAAAAPAPAVGPQRANQMVDLALSRGKTVADANAGAVLGSEKQRTGTLMSLAGAAQGERTEAMGGLETAASDSVSRAIDKNRAVALEQASRTNAVTGGLGLAAGYALPPLA